MIEFDKIHVGKRPKRDTGSPSLGADTAGGAADLQSPEDFVGYMQNMKLNGNPLFEMARTGGLGNVRSTATFNRKDKLVNFPFTFITPAAYIKTDMNIYEMFTIYMQVSWHSQKMPYNYYRFICALHMYALNVILS